MRPQHQQISDQKLGALIVKKILVPSRLDQLRQDHRTGCSSLDGARLDEDNIPS